jgi:hypothetical protein
MTAIYVYIQVIIDDWRIRNSSVCMVTTLTAGQPTNLGSVLGRDKRFPSFRSVQTVSGTTQPPFQCIQRFLSRGAKGPGCDGTTHRHLLPTLSMTAAKAFMACTGITLTWTVQSTTDIHTDIKRNWSAINTENRNGNVDCKVALIQSQRCFKLLIARYQFITIINSDFHKSKDGNKHGAAGNCMQHSPGLKANSCWEVQ